VACHAQPAVEAVLCDIDGVVRYWPASDGIERAHGLAPGALAAAAFAPGRLGPAVTGLVTDEQWRAGVAEELGDVCGSVERGRAAVAAWSASVGLVDSDVVELLTLARRSTRLALVSNATTRLDSDLDRLGLSGLADVVVNSCRFGVAKPDPRIYTIAARAVGVPVERCLFVDDTAANVAAAADSGMTAVHYRGIEDLRGALASIVGG
jgi:putative hydrolase of the HAD superfamily